jgi:hypothetical protein
MKHGAEAETEDVLHHATVREQHDSRLFKMSAITIINSTE